MGFQDILREDLNTVFFNTEEFAEKHMWNQNEIRAMIDDDNMMSKYSSEYECLERGSHLVLTPKHEFLQKPILNTVIVFDGDIYTLNEIKEETGMYAMFLEGKKG